MNISRKKIVLLSLSSALFLLGFSSCGGGSTDGGAEAEDASTGSPYVSDEDAGVEGTIDITSASLLDTGGATGGFFVDIVPNGDCDGDPTTDDPEPYFFTQYSVVVRNRTALTVFIDSVDITVFDSATNRLPKQSVTVAIGPGASGTVVSNFVEIIGGTKIFAKTLTPLEFGTFSVRFQLTGTTEFGEPFKVHRSITATFDAIDRCS
jgi:hypothetical protein